MAEDLTRARERATERSLAAAGEGGRLALGVTLALLGMSGGIVAPELLGAKGPLAGFAGVAAGLAVAAGAIVLTIALEARAAERGRAWVRGVGHGFDADAYLALLGRLEPWALRVEVAFAAPVPAARRAEFVDAVLGATGREAAWDDGGRVLALTTERLTPRRHQPKGPDIYSSAEHHAALVAFVERCLPALAAAQPVASLRAVAG